MAKVFIASTVIDLAEHREQLFLAIRRMGLQSDAMEDWIANPNSPVERILDAVLEADVMILLVGWRLGSMTPQSGISWLELEYEAARNAGKPIIPLLMDDTYPVHPTRALDGDLARVEAFRTRLQVEHVVAFFGSPEDLAAKAAAALARWFAHKDQAEALENPEDAPSIPPSAHVFLSYAREDLDIARAVSQRLEQEKWMVFWDRTIPVGMAWEDIVEAALDAAKCVVVLWSPEARNSEWVRIEAAEGADRKILAPAIIRETTIPLRFRRLQAASLIGWHAGEPDAPEMPALIDAVAQFVGNPNP